MQQETTHFPYTVEGYNLARKYLESKGEVIDRYLDGFSIVAWANWLKNKE